LEIIYEFVVITKKLQLFLKKIFKVSNLCLEATHTHCIMKKRTCFYIHIWQMRIAIENITFSVVFVIACYQ